MLHLVNQVLKENAEQYLNVRDYPDTVETHCTREQMPCVRRSKDQEKWVLYMEPLKVRQAEATA